MMKLKLKWKVLFSLLLPLSSANGQYSEWTNTGSGDWFTSTNWSLGALPSSSTDAAIGKGLAEISSGTAQARRIYLGSGGTGSMTISNGAALETGIGVIGGYYSIIGYSNGSATVTGTNSTWTFEVPIYVGFLGNGSLSIENGGKLQQSVTSNWGNSLIVGGSSGNGSVSISGTGSSLTTRNSTGIHIGNDQQGSLNISNGGSASVGYAFVGGNAGSNGSVTVTGANSKWTINNNMSIASYSNVAGSLTVSAGGNVTTGGDIFLGDSGQSSVLVTGAGSILRAGSSANANIWLARSTGGNATLTVADGGTVRAPGTWPMGIIYLTSTSSNASSQATLRIGNGGQAGTLLVSGVDGGHGQAKLVFDHSETAYSFNPSITGSTNIEQVGSGTTILTGNNGYGGSTKILGGTLAASSIQNFGWTGDITIGNARLRADASINFGSGSVPYGGRLFHLTGVAEIETTAAGTTVTIDRTVDGGGSLAKTGQGTLVLTGSALHTGGTTISNGTLQIGNGGSLGSIAGDIANNGNLIFNRSDSFSYAGDIGGNGNLTKLGAGALTLTGDHSYSGWTSLQGGSLLITGSFGAGGQISVNSGTTLGGSGTVNRNVLVYSGGILDPSLRITGQVTLSSESQVTVGNVSSGSVTANSGTQLVVQNAIGGTIDAMAGTASIGTLDGASLNLGNWGGTVDTLSSGSITTSGGSLVAMGGEFSGSISGTGGLTKSGDGTLTLTSQNTYSGTTLVAGGTLAVAASGATGSLSAPVRIINNGRFRVEAGFSTSAEVTGEVIAGTVGAAYEKAFGADENLENFGDFSSDFGSLDTTSYFGAGTVDVGLAVNASYSDAGAYALMSQILTLDGLDGTAFLLVMEAASIPANADPTMFFLAWLDETDGKWKNAVEGNHGEMGSLAGAYADTSYQDFLSMNSGWNPETMLGAYGVDGASGQVWAVIDHNSQFAAIPEPHSFVLLGISLCGMIISKRKRV